MRLIPAMCLALVACGGGETLRRDGGAEVSSDAGLADAGLDAGFADASVDAGPGDAGHFDAGVDAGAITWGVPDAVREGVFYHVYVRSFADSLPDSGVGALAGDGIGDLPGLTSHLDYIASLGVTGILLLPVFVDAWPETGGYLTVDHNHIAPEYGGDAAWDQFIAQAHARHLKVMMDLSYSLVSTQHRWFQAERARLVRSTQVNGACPFLGNQEAAPDGGHKNGWAAFDAGASECYWCDYSPSVCATPDITDSVVRQHFVEVALTWLNRGADGFRLDSAQSLAQTSGLRPTVKDLSAPATHAFWREFMTALKRARPDAFAMAELFDSTGYLQDGIDLGTDYLTWLGFTWSWQHQLARSGSPMNSGIGELLPFQVAQRPMGAWGAGFIGNHDVPGHDFAGRGSGRIADLLCPQPCVDVAPLRAAAQLQLGLPATPFIYFGEELGLHGAAGVDGQVWSRNPMQWTAGTSRGFTTGASWTPPSTDSVNVAAQLRIPRMPITRSTGRRSPVPREADRGFRSLTRLVVATSTALASWSNSRSCESTRRWSA